MSQVSREKTSAVRIDIFEAVETALALVRGIGSLLAENLGWGFQGDFICAKGKEEDMFELCLMEQTF